MVSHHHAFLHAIIAPLVLSLLLTITLVPRGVAAAASTQNGEEARWLVQSSKWATLSWIENEGQDLKSLVTSIAEFEGRIFFYLMKEEQGGTAFNAALTFSEAQVDTSQYFGAKCGPDGVLDPQDPRCAKLTITGVISPCNTTTKQLALDTLFATHPQMAHWPEGHGFVPHEMKINEEDGLWMIANFGGGGLFGAADYYGVVEPVHHAAKGFTPGRRRYLEQGGDPEYLDVNDESPGVGEHRHDHAGHRGRSEGYGRGEHRHDHGEGHDHGGHDHGGHDHGGHDHGGHDHGGHDHGGHDHGGHDHGGHDHGGHDHGEHQAEVRTTTPLPLLPRPKFGRDAAGHARWIVAKSLWTTVSTISSTNADRPFGNIRSIADGECFLDSTGLPYFYLPAPDPTAIDIESNDKIALSFAEASLAERLGDDGSACGGKDAEDPTCAKLTLIGRAKPLEDDARVASARRAFGAQHPRAEWLARGGAHTGGSFYTLEVTEITFLRSYGGYTDLSPEAYLSWKPDLGKLPGEVQCGTEGLLGISHGDYSLQQRIVASASRNVPLSFMVLVLVATLIAIVVVRLSKRMGGTTGFDSYSKRRGYAEASNVEEDTLEVEEGTTIT